jgi:hypothetical protein
MINIYANPIEKLKYSTADRTVIWKKQYAAGSNQEEQ